MAAVAYTVAVLITNQVLARHWDSDPLPEDVYLPLLFGPIAWLTCHLACRYAVRTQHRFDALRAAQAQMRSSADGANRPSGDRGRERSGS
ncbi:hypothetical protein ACWDBW_15380 [Streptomyces sp. NPDC001107]